MISFLLSLVTTLPSMLSSVFTWLSSKDETARAEALAGIQAYVDISAQESQLKAMQWGWAGTRWLMVIAAFGPIAHFSAVFMDSLPWFGWHAVDSWGIGPLASIYGDAEIKIILSFFAVSTVSAGIGGLIGLTHNNLAMKHTREMHQINLAHQRLMASRPIVFGGRPAGEVPPIPADPIPPLK